jgi:hypothetical protein
MKNKNEFFFNSKDKKHCILCINAEKLLLKVILWSIKQF